MRTVSVRAAESAAEISVKCQVVGVIMKHSEVALWVITKRNRSRAVWLNWPE